MDPRFDSIGSKFEKPGTPEAGSPASGFAGILGPQENPGKSSINDSLTNQWQRYLVQKQVAITKAQVIVEMPSGLRVRAIRPSLLLLINEGKVPDYLTPIVEKLINTAVGGEDPEKAVKDSVDAEFEENAAGSYAKYLALLQHVWLSAVIDPIFVHDPDKLPGDVVEKLKLKPESERIVFPMSVLEADDLVFFFQWCQGVDQSVQEFREKSSGSLAVPQDVEGLRNSAV